MSVKTVSLETAKKLKEAGFRQDTEYWYGYDWDWELKHNCHARERFKESCSAPTTDELLEELPTAHKILGNLMFKKVLRKKVILYECSYGNQDLSPFYKSESLPTTLASMWLWLKENNLLTTSTD